MLFLDELTSELPRASVMTDPDRMEGYRRDESCVADAGMPAAVFLPTTTKQVATAVRLAGKHDVGIVPRGAGSGLVGGATAVDGCLVIGFERMNRIVEIDEANQFAVVQPGVVNADISTAAAESGLFYAPDPASKEYCTIGGNIATNAGGLCCVKYGVTRDSVLGLEVVLGNGEIIRTGGRTIKGVAGLDLTSLFVGSEGTLGIVTEATVRLRPTPTGCSTAVAFFPTLDQAGEAVTDLVRENLGLSLLEIMDRASVLLVDDWGSFGMDREAAALLLLQVDDPEPRRTEAMERAVELCVAAGATETAQSSDPNDTEALLAARRLVGAVITSLDRTVVSEDVAVPRSRIPALIDAVQRLSARHDVQAVTYGHAGDGNLHPVLLAERSPEGFERCMNMFADVLEATLELGGTITGEHGVGQLKRDFLENEVGPTNLELQRAIKHAVDPKNRFVAGGWLDHG